MFSALRIRALLTHWGQGQAFIFVSVTTELHRYRVIDRDAASQRLVNILRVLPLTVRCSLGCQSAWNNNMTSSAYQKPCYLKDKNVSTPLKVLKIQRNTRTHLQLCYDLLYLHEVMTSSINFQIHCDHRLCSEIYTPCNM